MFVSYEKLNYVVFDDFTYISRRKKELMKKTYNSAVIKDLSNFDFVINKENQLLLNETIEELLKLEGYIKNKLKELPLILLRTEALSSTQIEYYNASNKNILLTNILKTNKVEANIISNSISALNYGIHNLELSLESLITLDKIILNKDNIDVRKVVNWIGKANSLPQNADYVPPHPKHLKDDLNNLFKLLERNDLHPLILSIVSHAYFEIIHPFEDGNGRVGRVLIQMVLNEREFLNSFTFPFSLGLLKNRDTYISSLNDFKDGNYNSIINCFLSGTLEIIPSLYDFINQLVALKNSWHSKIDARKDSFIWTLLDEIIAQPIFNVNYLKNKFKLNDQTIRNSINILLKNNIVKKTNENKRNVLYEAKSVFHILDNFNI